MYNNKYIHLPDSYFRILYARYCAGHPVLKMKLCLQKVIKYLHKSQESIQNIDSQDKSFSARSKKLVKLKSSTLAFLNLGHKVLSVCKKPRAKVYVCLRTKRVIHTDSKKVIVSLNLQEYGGRVLSLNQNAAVIQKEMCIHHQFLKKYT